MAPSATRPEGVGSSEVVLERVESPDGTLVKVDSPESCKVVDSPERRPEQGKVKNVRKRGSEEAAQFGKVCHNCRQRLLDHLTCSKCPLRFCGRCLLNRHGEKIELERGESVQWVCPRCRGGCGAGCTKTCCNCGPCRKSQKLEPTGLLVITARSHGFSNVHDYLVHMETGESAAAIAKRKEGRGWTSIDSGIVALVTEQHKTSPGWEKKKLRSRRMLVANLKWGNEPEVEAANLRIKLIGWNQTWDIGQKPKAKCPDSQTRDQTSSQEQKEKPGLQREGQTFTHEHTEDKWADFPTHSLDSLWTISKGRHLRTNFPTEGIA